MSRARGKALGPVLSSNGTSRCVYEPIVGCNGSQLIVLSHLQRAEDSQTMTFLIAKLLLLLLQLMVKAISYGWHNWSAGITPMLLQRLKIKL